MPGPQRSPPEMAGRNFKRPSLAGQARNLTHLVRPLESIAAGRVAVSPICLGLSGVISIKQKLASLLDLRYGSGQKRSFKKSQHRGEFHGAVHPESERLGA